jgi:hypothetical protein
VAINTATAGDGPPVLLHGYPRTHGIDHYLPEEAPGEVAEELAAWLS